MTPDQGADLARLLEQHRRCVEVADLTDRVARLEIEAAEPGSARKVLPIPYTNGETVRR